jgi:2-polyprenyl-3-methyl-5-hydroxy-6-metoxy-1,4-benzoquinol methylase
VFDWTKFGSNPNDPDMIKAWKEFYEQNIVRFNIFHEKHRDERILDLCRITNNGNIKLLDIGFAEHGVEFSTHPDWFHRKLRSFGNNIIFGLDLNEKAVQDIKSSTKYDNLIVGDATDSSSIIAGGEFDVIHAGDVIEHLSNLGGFLEFCKHNLKEDGRLVITTPNPCTYNAYRTWKAQGIIANMEHTCWITPTNMNELCRRVSLTFLESHYAMNKSKTLKNRIKEKYIFRRKDTLFGEFIYVLTK